MSNNIDNKNNNILNLLLGIILRTCFDTHSIFNFEEMLMATDSRNSKAYALGGPLADVLVIPIRARRNPTAADKAPVGTTWVNEVTSTPFIHCGTISGVNTWQTAPAAGAIAAASMTINPGDVTITAGDLDITAGDIDLANGNITLTLGTLTSVAVAAQTITASTTLESLGNVVVGTTLNVGGVTTLADTIINGNITLTGALDIQGDFDLDNTGSTLIRSTNNAPGCLTVLADGGLNESVLITSAQGTAAGSIALNSLAGGIEITAALNSSSAIHLTASDAIGGVTVTTGSGGFSIAADGGSILLASKTGNISIGTDAFAKNIAIGSATGTTTVDINTGTGGFTLHTGTGDIEIGNDIADHDIVIGDNSGENKLELYAGSKGAVISSEGDLDLQAGPLGADTGHINIGIGGDAHEIVIGNDEATSSISLISGDAGTTMESDGSTTIASGDSSNFTVTGAAKDLTLSSVGGSVNVSASESAADAIKMTASGVNGGIQMSTGTTGLQVTAPFVELNGIKIYTGAGAPDPALCTAVGDLYIRTNPTNANERLYIGTVIGTTWVHIAASA